MITVSRRYLCLLVIYGLMLTVIALMADLGIAAWVFDIAAVLPFGDKLGHMLLAGLLSFLLNNALHCRITSILSVNMLTGNLIAYLLVLMEEVPQYWITTRNLDIKDVLAAIVGIHLFGVLASRNVRKKKFT
jgi:VanZ family protein